MGRIKAKRAAKHMKMFEPFSKDCRFYVYSHINGKFLGFEFDGDDRDSMELHWKLEVAKCRFGDFVELQDYGQVVRRFDGQGSRTYSSLQP